MSQSRALTCAALLIVLSVLASSAAVADDSARSIKDALEVAGKNRAEIQSAIDRCNQSDLEKKSIRFLIRNMPDQDLKTLSGDFLVNNVRLAIKARNEFKFARTVPEEIFLNDVLPYASINERRDDWRKDFYERFRDLVKDCETTGQAAQQLNKNVFRILNVRYSTKRKKPDQSPYESMETGLASCTGLSVILADACRSVGVPARLAGTPLWVNKRGNHTWVEVWDEGTWKFTGACEYDPNGLNRGWFQGIASQADPDDPRHRIYATSFAKTGGHFPMVWKWTSKEVPGVDVTWRYIGKPRPRKKGEVTVAIKTVDATGKRVSTEVQVIGPGATKESGPVILAGGKTRNESNDANDYLEVNLRPGTYQLRVRWKNRNELRSIRVTEKDNQVHTLKLN